MNVLDFSNDISSNSDYPLKKNARLAIIINSAPNFIKTISFNFNYAAWTRSMIINVLGFIIIILQCKSLSQKKKRKILCVHSLIEIV